MKQREGGGKGKEKERGRKRERFMRAVNCFSCSLFPATYW